MRTVGELEAENVDEKRDLIFNARAVEDDVADLGRPRAVQDDARMPDDIRRYAHRQPIRRTEAKTIPTAGGGVERRGVARNLDAVALRLGAERIHRRAVIGGKMHAEQRGLRPLADGQHVMLAAGRAEMDAVALGANLFERPHFGVELRRLMKIANAELDAADASNPAVRHGGVTSCHRLARQFRTVRSKGLGRAMPTALNKTPIRAAQAGA